MSLILVLLAVSAFAGMEGRLFFQLRDQVNPRCDKLYDFTTSLLDMLKAEEAKTYARVNQIAMLTGVNLTNPEDVKAFVCRLTSAKTLRELSDVFGPLAGPYERQKFGYQNLQRQIAEFGGYTNADRAYGIFMDIKDWVKTLKVLGATPAEATSLANLTRFFEVMQVKYGSRWISWISWVASSDHQMILIPDPKEAAEELYATKSGSDVMEVLNITGSQATQIYNVILTGRAPFLRHLSDKKVMVMRDEVNILGELGFFTLPY